MNHTLSNRKWMITALLLFVVLVVYVIIYPPTAKNSEPVAKVNGVEISKEQLYQTVVASGGEQTVQNMIEKELIRQEAEKAGIQIQDADIDKELGALKKNFPSEEEFQQALVMNGMTLEGLKDEMKPQVMMKKILEPQVTVTDEEIKTYYDTNLEAMKTPEQVRASHILTATKEEAEAILADLKNGADFAKIAQEKSQDPGSKENGGDLDYFIHGTMEEPFETAAFAMETGALSDVVQTSNGYHIIKVTDHKAAATPTLDEKKEEIRDTLINEKLSALVPDWLEEKKSAAKIENYLSSGKVS